MAWIESHQSLRGHPKLRRLARHLGVTEVAAAGHLHYLWWWALDYAKDGQLNGYDEADIADAACWDGDPAVLVKALLAAGGPKRAGFLERGENHLLIHDWDEYAGKLIARRERNARAMRDARVQHVGDTCTTRVQHAVHTCKATNQPTNHRDKEVTLLGVTSTENRLCALARQAVPGWVGREDDTAAFAKLLTTWTEEQIVDTINRLAADQATRSQPFKNPRQALGNWLKRVKPAVQKSSVAPVDVATLAPWQRLALSWFDRPNWDASILSDDYDEQERIIRLCSRGYLSREDVLAGRLPA